VRKLIGIFALTVCCGLPAWVLGQPQVGIVSGTFSHGQTVDLSGTQFGNKSPAAPYKYDNFESGTPGAFISGGWHLDAVNPAQEPTYSTARSRVAGSQSAFQDFTRDNYNSTIGLTNLNVGKLYFSGWFYNTVGGAPSMNFKWLAFRAGRPGDWANTTFPQSARFDVYPYTNSGHQYLVNCTGVSAPADEQNWSVGGGTTYPGAWHRLESWFDKAPLDRTMASGRSRAM
jgi:hypothetical protein